MQNEKQKTYTIMKADLTNREVNIINGNGCSKYFVFAVQLSDEFSYASIWVDKYDERLAKFRRNRN